MNTAEEKESRMGQKTEGKAKIGLVARYMKLDTKKKIQYAAVLLIVIVILAIYFSSFAAKKETDNSEASSAAAAQASYTTTQDSIALQLKQTLSTIEGAGKVEVMITYESTGEIVPAMSIDKQMSTTVDEGESGKSTTSSENTQSEVVTINGSDGIEALVLKENSPPITGVIVVAEGADNIEVRLNLLSAVQTLLNISPDQVNVYKMNIE
jgi:stage III sporulation protein AG